MYLAVTSIFLLTSFYFYGGFSIIKRKYSQFRQLNKLVEIKYKTMGMIVWVSIQMICKMYWLQFLQWMNSSISKPDRNTLIITYVHNGDLYKIVIKPKKGPNNVLLIIDENNDDVTDLVRPYIGCGQNWHNSTFKPSFWDKKGLTFYMNEGPYSFERDEYISLPSA